MKIIVVGATGTIGQAVAAALGERHEVLKASRKGDVRVDLTDPGSIRAMFESCTDLDAVVCAAGDAAFAGLDELTDDDFAFGLAGKLMGQINLVRFGRQCLRDGGSFTLTSGMLAHRPTAQTALISTLNMGVEGFVAAAARDMPRGLRINAVSPPLVTEPAEKMGWGAKGTPAAEVAELYVQAVEGDMTGQALGPMH